MLRVSGALARAQADDPLTGVLGRDGQMIWRLGTADPNVQSILRHIDIHGLVRTTVQKRLRDRPLAAPPAQPRRGLEDARLARPALCTGCWHAGCRIFSGVSEDGLRLLVCGGCGTARYCSPECQRAAWKTAHKAACKRV